MSIPGQPGNPSHSEECDDDNETLPQPSNHSEATNEEDDASSSQNQNETGCNDSEQSLVSKICYNVSNFLSKLIQNAKDKFGPANRQHSDEYDRSDGSDVQPAKRRRLNEFEEDSDYSHNRSIIRPSESNRSDQSSQTSHPYAPTQGVYSREICRSVSVPSVFERVSSGRHQDETSVFLPSVTHYSVQPDEREEQQVEGTEDEGVEMVQTDEHQEVRANEQQVKARKEPYRFEPFDPFKYLAEIDKSPVNPKHRITTFLGNRVYRKRQQKLRRGVIGRLFFPSPQKPNKSLDTRNESSQRPSFNRAVYRDGCDERIPPEYGGSPFYNGLTRYGGASAANTLSTHFTAPRSSPGQDNSVLIRNPVSSTSRKRPRLDQESNAPVMSSTSQRILEIVDAYDVARKDDKKRLELPSCASITQELDEILSRPHLSTSPQMLQLIRQQNLASIVCEREEHVPYPPIAPLIDVMPLYLYHKTDTTEQRETAASDEHRTATGELRGNVESTVERNVVSEESAQPAVSQHQILDDVRTSEVTELPPALENETAHTATLLTNSVTQERDQTLGDTANANCLTVERNAISFDDPICLGNSNQEFETVVDNVPTFTFAEPQLLGQHRQRPITSLRQLLAESVSDWENDMGLVHNETHQLLSVAGKNVNKCQKNATASKSATHAAKENFTTIVYAQLSCWECNICSVRNEPASAVCACCEAEKPTLAANRSGKTANSKKNETVSVSPFSNLNSIANQQIPNELMQQTVSSDASATGTGTTQTPKPSSSAGFTAPCTGSLQSLVAGTDSIFPKQQRNMSFASGVTFSASPTVSKINQKTTLSGGSSFASEFGAKTNTTNINASSNNNNASVGNVSWKNNDTNPNPFGSFGRPHAEFSSIFSSSTPNSPEFQRNETAHKAVEAPGRNQPVAFATDLKLNPNADVNVVGSLTLEHQNSVQTLPPRQPSSANALDMDPTVEIGSASRAVSEHVAFAEPSHLPGSFQSAAHSSHISTERQGSPPRNRGVSIPAVFPLERANPTSLSNHTRSVFNACTGHNSIYQGAFPPTENTLPAGSSVTARVGNPARSGNLRSGDPTGQDHRERSGNPAGSENLAQPGNQSCQRSPETPGNPLPSPVHSGDPAGQDNRSRRGSSVDSGDSEWSQYSYEDEQQPEAERAQHHPVDAHPPLVPIGQPFPRPRFPPQRESLQDSAEIRHSREMRRTIMNMAWRGNLNAGPRDTTRLFKFPVAVKRSMKRSLL